MFRFADISYDKNNHFNTYDNTGYFIGGQSFGSKQNLTGKTNLSVNFTLIAFTQMRLDIGYPINYSVTTSLFDYNYLDDTGSEGEEGLMEMFVHKGAVTIQHVDFDCNSSENAGGAGDGGEADDP